MLEILPPRAKASVEETRKLFVGNLPPGSTSEDVRKYFENYGEIEEIYMPQGSGKDFSFVTFKEQSAARTALLQARMRAGLPRCACSGDCASAALSAASCLSRAPPLWGRGALPCVA